MNSCNSSSSIRSLYNQWHTDLLKFIEKNINNQSHTQVLQICVHVSFYLMVIKSWLNQPTASHGHVICMLGVDKLYDSFPSCPPPPLMNVVVSPFVLGVVAEWSKVLSAVPWPLMVWFTLALGIYQLSFVSWVFHVILSFVHFIWFDTLCGLRAFRKPLPYNMYLSNLKIANHILIKKYLWKKPEKKPDLYRFCCVGVGGQHVWFACHFIQEALLSRTDEAVHADQTFALRRRRRPETRCTWTFWLNINWCRWDWGHPSWKMHNSSQLFHTMARFINGKVFSEWRSIRSVEINQWEGGPLSMTSQWVITLLGMSIVTSQWLIMLIRTSIVISQWVMSMLCVHIMTSQCIMTLHLLLCITMPIYVNLLWVVVENR